MKEVMEMRRVAAPAVRARRRGGLDSKGRPLEP
jgi:hypothetical protein